MFLSLHTKDMVIYTTFAILVSSEFLGIANLTSKFYTFWYFPLIQHLFSVWRTPFSISYRTSVVVINYLSFHLGMSLISEGQLCWVQYSGLQFIFSFNIINISSHSTFCVTSADKSTFKQTDISLCIISFLLLLSESSLKLFRVWL